MISKVVIFIPLLGRQGCSGKPRWLPISSNVRQWSERLYHAELTDNHNWHPFIDHKVMTDIAEKLTTEILHSSAIEKALAARRSELKEKSRAVFWSSPFLIGLAILGLFAVASLGRYIGVTKREVIAFLFGGAASIVVRWHLTKKSD